MTTRTLLAELSRVDRGAIEPKMALRNAFGVALALAVGFYFDRESLGLAAGLGALIVSYSDGRDAYLTRARRMLASTALCSLATLGGALASHYPLFAVTATAAFALVSGLAVVAGRTAADLGTFGLVMFVVFASRPMSTLAAVSLGGFTFVGGLAETALSLAAWPLRRYAPERRELGKLYLELAVVARADHAADDAPPASAQMTAAQHALDALSTIPSLEADRYRSLLSQAERIRLRLVSLSHLERRAAEGPARVVGALRSFRELAALVTDLVGAALLRGVEPEGVVGPMAAIDAVLDGLEASKEAAGSEETDEHVVRALLVALAGQLRAAVDLAGRAGERGRRAFDRSERRRPWRKRFSGTWATVLANLTPRSAAFRHGVRLALGVLVGEALSHALGLSRGYWLPMTIVIVLKPDYTATTTRGILRVGGTALGLAIATALFRWLPMQPALEIGLVALFVSILRSFGRTHYGVFAVAVSAVVVLMASLGGADPRTTIVDRGVATALGGAIAMLLYLAWPTWERTQVRELVATMLDRYRSYFDAVVAVGAGRSGEDAVEPARVASRVARSNVLASLARLELEPGTTEPEKALFMAIQSSANRFAHSVMSLDTGEPLDAPDERAFDAFARDVGQTLSGLARALRRERRSEVPSFPDLRKDHDAIARPLAGSAHPLVAELDRTTNSLDTLREEVLRLVGEPTATTRGAPPPPRTREAYDRPRA